MRIIAVDPGTSQSAWVFYDGKPMMAKIVPNEELLEWLLTSEVVRNPEVEIVIEMVASFGLPVGSEIFETCVWIGRFWQATGREVKFMYRKDVKLALCGKTKGVNDAVIRQALLDRFGPGREIAIGTKKKPGPLYGIHADEWAALAVAVTYEAMQEAERGIV